MGERDERCETAKKTLLTGERRPLHTQIYNVSGTHAQKKYLKSTEIIPKCSRVIFYETGTQSVLF
eukprot:SAG31_NODE_1021_length_10327_cov_17.940653_1_plen_65_part_00